MPLSLDAHMPLGYDVLANHIRCCRPKTHMHIGCARMALPRRLVVLDGRIRLSPRLRSCHFLRPAPDVEKHDDRDGMCTAAVYVHALSPVNPHASPVSRPGSQ